MNEGLEVAIGAIVHMGERRHVSLLKRAKIEPFGIAAAIIADTEFGVMALCDQLEASLDAAATTRRSLLDALLAEALSPVLADQEAAA